MPAFADRVLKWWDKHGRKDLPWQHDRNLYRVWVSEIMLQQTQVATVIPYFDRFMQRYPTLENLAAAALDDVLAMWSGLGYYARCRNLHTTAVICASDHNGELPSDLEMLEALPGIGASTAAAIVSQALNTPVAILDGNVKRLLSRHAAIDGWPGRGPVQKQLWLESEKRLTNNRGADYTQAVMDLGATLCTSRNPDCDVCPVNTDCQALKAGRVDTLPTPKPAKALPQRATRMLIARNPDGHIMLERRPPTGIWGGLWCFPEFEDLQHASARFNLETTGSHTLPDYEHRFTHFALRISPTLLECRERDMVASPTDRAWYTLEQALQLGIPKPVRATLESIAEETNE